MVALPNTYKPTEVEASTGGGSIPAGKYKSIVQMSYEKANKDGKIGSHVVFEYQIVDGPYKGQKIFDRFNFNNPNQKAVDIAFSQFKSLATACGKTDTLDTDALNNSVFVLTYGPQKDNPQYSEVKKYEPSTASTEGYSEPSKVVSVSSTVDNNKPSWA